MISIFYTGDRRHNFDVMRENHANMIQQLSTLDTVEVSWFTKDYAQRGVCPFNEGGADDHLRRGQGGAVQVWDFMSSADRVQGDVVIKFRTDIWFTESSRQVIMQHVQDILQGRMDIVFFGSDLVNDNQGQEHTVYDITPHDPARIQDFIIAARRSSLADSQQVIDRMLAMPPKKVRSGNKTFRYILGTNCRAQGVRCHLWLIRRYYASTPTDQQVCHDYIMSYMDQSKVKDNSVLDPAWAWWSTY